MSLPYIPATGNPSAKLMILGEAPWTEEVRQGLPFVGSSGKQLDDLLIDAGIKRSDCWISNVCKYPVPPNKPKEKIPFQVRAKNVGVDLQKEIEDLQKEINNVKPNTILALGGTALWATTGKTKISAFRGSILFGMGTKVVSTYHPAHLLHSSTGSEIKGYWNKYVMVHDFKRALQQSGYHDLRLPQRFLEICRSSQHLETFFKRYDINKPVSVDIEAGGHCLPVCMGFSYDKGHGICVPLWNEDGISSIPTSDLSIIWGLIAERLSRSNVIGQNFNYDRDKILRLGFIISKLYSDTMYKAFAINPEFPKGLAFNTSIYTDEPYYKDEGMYEGSYMDLFTGCARDSCVTKEVDENMDPDLDEIGQRPYYENYLLKLPEMYWGIERNGFTIDADARDRLLSKYVEWSEKLQYKLFTLVNEHVNVNSPKQVQVLLYDKLGLPRKKTTGEEDLTELINSPTIQKNEEIVDILETILETRRVRRTLSSSLMALPDFDGKLKTTYFPCLETGRSSTSMQEPPIRPTIELRDENGKKKNKALGFPFQTITKHGDVGNDVREMMLP